MAAALVAEFAERRWRTSELELVAELAAVAVGGGGGGDVGQERPEFAQELEASFAEEDAGLLIDADDAIADLRTRR